MLSGVRSASEIPQTHSIKHEGFGGFPGPFDLIHGIFKRAAPITYRRLERSMTIPSMTTLQEKKTPWLNFNGLVVGRNSDFRTNTLTAEQIERLTAATGHRRLVTLEEVATAVCFLCSPENTGITGQFIAADLGFSRVRIV